MRKRRYFLSLFLLILFFSPLSGQAEDQEDRERQHIITSEEMIDQLDLKPIQQHWDSIATEYGGYLPELEKADFKEFIKENRSLSLKSILHGLLKFLLYEVLLNGKLLGILLLLTLFSAVLQTMHAAFENSAISKIAYFVVYIVLFYITLNSLISAFTYTKDTISTMMSLMIALIPLLLGLMASFGQMTSVAFFHPIIIMLVQLSSVLVSSFVLPLLMAAALLMMVSHLSENYRVTHLANLLRMMSLGALGIFLTIFLGVMSVQGVTSAIQDSVMIKTTKFITGNFIPVIGQTISEATDTILSASLLLKNTIGLIGVTVIILISIFPAIKIFIIALIYKLAAAILQPIGDGPIISSLNTLSTFLLYILASLLIVTFMFFISIVIIVAAGNITFL